MAASRKNTSAKFMQVLEYMDGPQAVLLDRSADSKIVAVAIDKEGERHPFFGAAISFDQWDRYRRGTLDLRYLFMYPRWKEWFVFNWDLNGEGFVELRRVPKDAFAEEHYVPEAGFFSYDHSEPIKSSDAELYFPRKAIERMGFGICRISPNFIINLRIFMFSHYLLRNLQTPMLLSRQRRLIRESFLGHPLRGGSIAYV